VLYKIHQKLKRRFRFRKIQVSITSECLSVRRDSTKRNSKKSQAARF